MFNPGINLIPNQGPDPSPWGMESYALRNIARIEDEEAGGILGTGTKHTDPNILRDFLSRFMALLGLEYGFEDEVYQKTKVNKEQEAKTHNLAFPANEPSFITAA